MYYYQNLVNMIYSINRGIEIIYKIYIYINKFAFTLKILFCYLLYFLHVIDNHMLIRVNIPCEESFSKETNTTNKIVHLAYKEDNQSKHSNEIDDARE